MAALKTCSSTLNPMLSHRFMSQTISAFTLSLRKTSRNLFHLSSILDKHGHRPTSLSKSYPLSGLEDELVGYMFGKKKATEVAHLVWRHVLHKGDAVIDATCGNGYDTLAMLKMVADESGSGRVYGMDIQTEALDNTYSLLDETVTEKEKQLVKLFQLCHSRMDDVIPDNTAVSQDDTVAVKFGVGTLNGGYLPGGDKAVITTSKTTTLALEAAKKILISGGLISLVVYVGHPGGRFLLKKISGKNWKQLKTLLLDYQWITGYVASSRF